MVGLTTAIEQNAIKKTEIKYSERIETAKK
jgi:hypothetical protein